MQISHAVLMQAARRALSIKRQVRLFAFALIAFALSSKPPSGLNCE
jgi:hypothetical protein